MAGPHISTEEQQERMPGVVGRIMGVVVIGIIIALAVAFYDHPSVVNIIGPDVYSAVGIDVYDPITTDSPAQAE